MRFLLEVPASGPAAWDHAPSFRLLRQLVDRAEDAGHELAIRDAEYLEASGWFLHEASGIKDRLLELRELGRAAAWIPTTGAHRVSTPDEAARAQRVAFQPLGILVENKLRDGALLEFVVLLFADDQLLGLWTSPPTPPVIEILHSGGIGEMPGLIEKRAEEVEQVALPMRLIVVADSDRKNASQTDPSEDAQRVEAAARRRDAWPRVWPMRAGENYIPDRYWQKLKELDSRNPSWTRMLDELIAMSPVERNFCDMGAQNKGRKQLPKKYDETRPYHLQRLLRELRDDMLTKPECLTEWRESIHKRDPNGDLLAVLDLVRRER